MPEWDLEGRVVVVRKDRLAIVNVYAVNGSPKPYSLADRVLAADILDLCH